MPNSFIALAVLILPFLTFVFMILKLCGIVSWSWWGVISPLWLPIVIVGGIWAGFLIFLFLMYILYGG